MPSTRQFGQNLAKVLGIKLEDPDTNNVTRGESIFSTHTTDSFVEQQPTSGEWLEETIPSRQEMLNYLRSLFPFLSWIGFYNLQWFLGDLVAGMLSLPSLSRFIGWLLSRYNYRCSCCTTRHGLRQASQPSSGIWFILILHGCPPLLVLRDFQRYHHRSELERNYTLASEVLLTHYSLLLSCRLSLVPSSRMSPRSFPNMQIRPGLSQALSLSSPAPSCFSSGWSGVDGSSS